MVTKEPRPKREACSYTLSDVRALARIVNQYDLSEVEVERGGERLRLRRERKGTLPAGATVAEAPAQEIPTRVVSVPAPAVPVAAAEQGIVVTSPFVGTFYRAPSPESSPFVEVGQQVKKGQVLCIVEAMKLMNEIEAEIDGKILEVLAKNAEAVEFGQPLFRLLPLL